MDTSPEIGEIAAAMAKAQGALSAPSKNREVTVTMKAGGKYKFKYSTLDHLIDHIRKPFTDNGLWFIQRTEIGLMVTRLLHASGQWMDSAVPMPNLPNDPQGAGSLLSYFRRYGLATAAGLASDDDDNANDIEGGGYETRDLGRTKLEGPYTSPTALKKAVHEADREIRACGDIDMLEAYLQTKEFVALKQQLHRDAPDYLYGGDSLPPEHEPLKGLVDRMRKDFEDIATANHMTDLANT